MTGRDAEEPVDRLVIAYSFAPFADTSAIVASKRVVAAGAPVDVIQQDLSQIRGHDASLEELLGSLVRDRAMLPGKATFGSWGGVERYCQQGLAVLAGWESDGRSYREIYSRAHFLASHVLAALIKADHPHWHWQAEFSDPVARDGLGQVRSSGGSQERESELAQRLHAIVREHDLPPPPQASSYGWAEYLPLALAEEIWFTNEAQRDHILAPYRDHPVAQRARERSRIAPHPAPPEPAYRAHPAPVSLSAGRRQIGYFGNFYASQHPQTVFAALALLRPADRSSIALHLFTSSTEQVQEWIDEYRVGDVVSVAPPLPYLDFLAQARSMDVLLALDAATPPGAAANPVRLSKWSDYSGAGVAVWGVVESGSELDHAKLAYRSPLRHVTAAMQVLTTIARS